MFLRRRICAHFRDAVSTDMATRSDTLPRTWLRGYDRRGRSLIISFGGATEREGNNEGGRARGRLRRSHASNRTHVRRAEKLLTKNSDAVRGRESQGDRVVASRRNDSARHSGRRNEIPRHDRMYAKILSRYLSHTAWRFPKPRRFHKSRS